MCYFSEKRVQRYAFLRTQPKKMHKNDRNVHTSAVLCNKRGVFLLCRLEIVFQLPGSTAVVVGQVLDNHTFL